MGATVAEIAVAVRLDQAGVPNGLAQLKTSAESAAAGVGRAADATAGGTRRMHFALQQVGFGIQDFVQQLGPMGLRGALSASANNWSQVAAIMSPMGGAFAGVAITLASVTIPSLLNMASASKEARNELAQLLSQMERMSAVREAMFGIAKSSDVSGVKTSGSAADDVRNSERELDLARRRKDAIEAQAGKTAELLMGKLLASGDFTRAGGLDKMGGDTKDRGRLSAMLQRMGMPSTSLTGRTSSSVAFELLEEEKKTGRAEADIGDGKRVVMELGKISIVQLNTEKERAAILEKIDELNKEAFGTSADIKGTEEKINKLKERGVELTKEELNHQRFLDDEVKKFSEGKGQLGTAGLTEVTEGLSVSDANLDKLRKIIDESSRATGDVLQQEGAGVISFSQAQEKHKAIDAKRRRDVTDLIQGEAEETFKANDSANEKFTRERERREKDVARLSTDLESRNLDERSRKIFDIRKRLESDVERIVGDTSPGAERDRLKGLAAGAAERDLRGLKTPGGEKVGLTGLHDMIQKGLFGGSMEKSAADTAKNTGEQLKKLDTLINEVKQKQVAVAG